MENTTTPIIIPSLEPTGTSIVNDLESNGLRFNIDKLCGNARYPYKPLSTFSIAHRGGESLLINFFTRCNYLRAVETETNGPVYEDSSSMFFIRPVGARDFLYVDVNCIGTVRAFRIDPEKGNSDVRLLSPDEISEIKVEASCGNRPFMEVEGLFTWDVLLEIPLRTSLINLPEGETQLQANFMKSALETQCPHLLSWHHIPTEDPRNGLVEGSVLMQLG